MKTLLGTLLIFGIVGLFVGACVLLRAVAGGDPTNDPGGPHPWA